MPNDLPQVDPQSDLFRRQMAQFFDASTDAILFLDREYRFLFLNRRAREVLAPAGDLLGANLFERFPNTVFEGSPFVENYDRSMNLGETGEFEAFYPEPFNFWLRVQSYPTDAGIMVFFRDITQEKLAQEELRRKSEETQRQHAELETIYSTAPIGLALFDVSDDFRYLRLNNLQAAFFGLKPEQIVGRSLMEMAPIPGLDDLFRQVRRGQPVVNHPIEGTLITDPGNYRYWTVSYFPVHAPDGSIQAITAASLEITQQKKSEQALVQSEKLAAVGRLASSIAHEINNPLESVTNLLYLAQHSESMHEARGFLEMAERELRRAAAITTQTLRFHKQSTNPQAVTPESLFDDVLSVHLGRFLNSGVEVSKRFRANTPVRCFEGEVRQVISNLINNALDAIGHNGGGLRLRTRVGTNWASGDHGIVLTIADTGTGMSPETQARLFSPFFTTKGVTGTGLGLWISKEIVQRHRGSLRVRSSPSEAHHGTVFTLFFPFDAVLR